MSTRDAWQSWLAHMRACTDCRAAVITNPTHAKCCAVGESWLAIYESWRIIEAEQRKLVRANTYNQPELSAGG